MPNRILRDWTDSEKVNEISFQAEVLFVRLIMKADDYGRYTANPRLIKSICFPLKDGLRDADISRFLAECEKAGLIAVYKIEEKSFLEIRNFRQRTRASVSKYPAPDGQPDKPCQNYDGQVTVKRQTDDGHPRTETETETETEADTKAREARGGFVIPESLASSQVFVKAWKSWIEFRKQIKKPLKSALSTEKQLAMLAEIGPSEAAKCIEKSIQNGWQGLFPAESSKKKCAGDAMTWLQEATDGNL